MSWGLGSRRGHRGWLAVGLIVHLDAFLGAFLAEVFLEHEESEEDESDRETGAVGTQFGAETTRC